MVTHWDEVEPVAIERTHLRGWRWRLGAAAGAERVGLSRYRLAAGDRAMPVHVHADEEELFFVLGGEGLSWQDGRTYEPRAGVVERPALAAARRAESVQRRGRRRSARRARARGAAPADDRQRRRRAATPAGPSRRCGRRAP